MKIAIFNFIFLIIATLGYSQQLNINVIPPSPNASALNRYGYIPVSQYTGVPNITIPLWEVKSKNLKIPINLSYHSGGNKVEDMGTWVGLGWVLNSGGVISRTVLGRPDESTYGFLETMEALNYRY
jgi:hypothetical protein